MGHLVDAIKKLEQLRAADSPAPVRERKPKPAPGRAPKPTKSTAKTRRVDKPHAAAAPKGTRRRKAQPKPSDVAIVDGPHLAICRENGGRATPAEADACEPAAHPEPAGPAEPTALDLPLPEIETAAPAEPTKDASIAIAEALAVLGAPAITQVPPAVPLPESELTPADRADAVFAEVAPSDKPAEADTIPSTPAVVWQIPAPVVSDRYLRIATALAVRGDSQIQQSILLVAVSQVGVDAVCLPALAAALSRQGSVLWIDTRHTQPISAEPNPAADNQPGWGQLVAGKAGWDEVIRPTSLPGVSYVGCGPATPGPESAQSPPIAMPDRYCWMLIDGGLASQGALLGKSCRSVGLLVAVGHDRRGEVEAAIARLASVGAASPLLIAAG